MIARHFSNFQLNIFILSVETAKKNGRTLTPYFEIIVNNYLFNIWDNLENLKDVEDHDEIDRFDLC